MTTATHGQDATAELAAELHHADTLITEQAERIEALEAEVARLWAALADATGAAAQAAAHLGERCCSSLSQHR